MKKNIITKLTALTRPCYYVSAVSLAITSSSNPLIRFLLAPLAKLTSLTLLAPLALLVFISISFLSISFLLVNPTNTHATDSLTLTLSGLTDDTLAFDLVPQSNEGTFVSSNDLTATVNFTGLNGYTLSIRTNNPTSTNNNSTTPASLINGNYTLPSLSEAISESTFSTSSTYNNMWGYKPSKLNSITNTNYLPAPTLEGDIIDKTNTSGTDIETAYTISLGARVNLEQAPGSYTNTFVIAVVANQTCNPNAGGILEAYCMQDMNDSVANSMTVHKQYQLKDDRDGTLYYVAKMNDGRIWMTQNLDLDLKNTGTYTALTSNNTDLNQFGSNNYDTSNGYTCSNADTTTNCTAEGEIITWTPINETVATPTGGFVSTYVEPQSYDNGTVYYYTDSSDNNTSYSTLEACEADHSDGTCEHYHTGNYYNFTAAVASNNTDNINSGTMANSICPKGWRLPNNVSSYGDANQTWLAEGIMTGIVTSIEHYGTYTTNGYNKLSNAPLYTTRSGYRASNSNPTINMNGYFMVNTLYDSIFTSAYYFTPTYPYPYGFYASTDGVWFTRAYEAPIRCIARETNTGSTVINFDKNSDTATGTMNDLTINANQNATLIANAFTNSGYVFNGWNTKVDGSGVSYTNMARYYAAIGSATNNVTLYAQWTPAHSLTVQADTNLKVSVDGGSTWSSVGDSLTTTVGEGQTIVLKAKDDISGTVFDNWSLISGSGTFFDTVWRSTNTKTTTFAMGSSNATIKANGTSTYTTLSSSATPNMKDITSCPDWLPELDLTNSTTIANTTFNVQDTRGTTETYMVAKLKDGKCWMLDNLRLGSLTDTIALTHEDTNLPENGTYTLPAGNTWTNTPYYGKINTDYKDKDRSDYPNLTNYNYGPGSNKVGTYYNYCAASAGTVCTANDTAFDATSDVCPAGWRMPTGGEEDNVNGYGEYYSLYYTYNSNAANFRDALSTPLSGYFLNSTQYSLGKYGIFWSSTFSGGYVSYDLYVSSSGVNSATDISRRYHGFSMRCVFGS